MRKNAIRFMLNDYPDVMSIDEMCRALSIGKKTGYKLLQTGQIRFLKIGAHIAFRKSICWNICK